MSIEMRFLPIEKWPGTPTPLHKRRHSTFRSSWSQTADLLESELEHLKASDTAIQADCDRSQLRLDGKNFRANAKLRGPGIVVSFSSRGKHLSFPCDAFLDWQDNVRAVALTLQHLRAVDRYGVTQRDEQYTGWAKLPGPVSSGHTGFNGNFEAMQFLRDHGIPTENHGAIRGLAIRTFHPDKHGGDDSLWKQWLSAAGVLGIEV